MKRLIITTLFLILVPSSAAAQDTFLGPFVNSYLSISIGGAVTTSGLAVGALGILTTLG